MEDGAGSQDDWLDNRLEVALDAGEAAGVQQLLRALVGLFRRLGRYREAQQDGRRAMEALGFPLAGTAYRHHSVHPEIVGPTPHPDNEAALASMVGALGRSASRHGNLREEPDVLIHTAERNLVLVGSPSSDGLTRSLFGYEPDPTEQGLVLRDESLSSQLHFRWELDPAEIEEAAQVRRYVAGRGESRRRNWAIVDQRHESEAYHRPSTSDDGFLEQDFLLITRMPNFVTPYARHSGRVIVNVGGAHGTATRAIGAVLRSEALVREIRAAVGNADFYQALVRVSIENDEPRSESSVRMVSLVAALPLTLSEQVWGAAEVGARQSLVDGDWFSRGA